MISKRFNLKIILYLIFILISGIAGAYLILQKQFILGSLSLMVTTILITSFIYFLNDWNRKIAYFIDAVRNEDSSLKFPENIKNKALQMLHESLNKVNDFITKTKIQIEHKEKFYEALIEHSATGLISINEHGDFEILNNTARKYIGVEYTANIHMLKQRNKALYHVLNEIKPGETTTTKIFINDDFFLLSVRCTEIIYLKKKLKLISLHNIRFELEEKEIESWQKLFRVITHEIMNSIAPIISVSNTLGRMYKKDDEFISSTEITDKIITDTAKGLTVIEDMSNSLMNFVNSYRSLNKIPKPDFKEMHAKPWLENIRTMAQKIINEENVRLKLHVKPGTGYFMGDENLLNQVIINLIKNANEALENNEDGLISISCSSDYPGKILIEIADNGAGIDFEDIDQVFVPFFTTKEHGTGIGLSLCRQIIRLHNGNITVKSKPGEGTVFRINV